MNIFVAKLNFDTQNEDLKRAFEAYGEVSSANVIFDKFNGKSKGFGFVEMPDDGEAKEAISGLNDSNLQGRNIVVKQAEDRRNNNNNSRSRSNW